MNWTKFLFSAVAFAFAAQAGAQARELPDFTRLVEEQGAAVDLRTAALALAITS